jgi:APA family basic amino acid/polyamine antiporter
VALARDGLFPSRLAQLHPRLGTPAAAIALQAGLASLLVVLGTFSDIVAYFVFVTVAFIAASVASLYRLGEPPPGAFRAPARRLLPALVVGLSLLLLVVLVLGRPRQALLGTLVVALGAPAYLLLRRAGILHRETT